MSLIRFGAMLLRRPFDAHQVVGGGGAGSSTDRAPTVIDGMVGEEDEFGDLVLPGGWIVSTDDGPPGGPGGPAGHGDVADDMIPLGADAAAFSARSPMPPMPPMPANPPIRTRRPRAKAKAKVKQPTGNWKTLNLSKGLGGPLYVKIPCIPSAPSLDLMQSFSAELDGAMQDFRRGQSFGHQLSFAAVLKERFRSSCFKVSSKPPGVTSGVRLPRSVKQTYEYDGELLVRIR